MWNCNWGLPFAHGGWLPGPFGLLLHLLLAIGFVYVLILIGRAVFARGGANGNGNRDSGDSLEILRARFARGEISAEEFQRMREILLL